MDTKASAGGRDTGARREMPFDDGAGQFPSAPRSAVHCRTAAARARAIQATTTTPRLKQYLGEMIARYEERAADFERERERAIPVRFR